MSDFDQTSGNPYRNMKVKLVRQAPTRWSLSAEEDGEPLNQAVMFADEATALSRAETLAGWFGCELVVEKVGV